MRPRILVVDDEPGMLRTVQRILEQAYDVAILSAPEEALGRALQFEPDLAILDVRMPGQDGFELMGQLRQTLPDLDVILMTGSVGEMDQKLVRAIRQKAFYFVQKPFDREVLLTLVERCLDLRRLEQANRRHVRRLEGELAEARAFQRSLLPDPQTSLGTLRLCARYLPCDELCGDFYDYAAPDPRALAFLVADVSGHGATAAMLTGVVKSSFQSCHAQGYEPRSVIESIWSAMRTFQANRFVTTFCGRLHPGLGRLEYVSAGHPPPILWGPRRPAVLLASTGPLISPVIERPSWRQETAHVTSEDRLLVYTDGVTEAQGAAGFFGEERLLETVLHAPQSGEALLDAVLHAVAEFAGGRRLRDDVTLLTLAEGAEAPAGSSTLRPPRA